MATRRTTRRDFWLGHLRKWRAQGGTLKAYAQANGLAVGSLYAANSGGAGARSKKTSSPAPTVTLLPIEVSPREARGVIRVSLPSGVLLEIPGDLSAADWQPLLTLFGSRP